MKPNRALTIAALSAPLLTAPSGALAGLDIGVVVVSEPLFEMFTPNPNDVFLMNDVPDIRERDSDAGRFAMVVDGSLTYYPDDINAGITNQARLRTYMQVAVGQEPVRARFDLRGVSARAINGSPFNDVIMIPAVSTFVEVDTNGIAGSDAVTNFLPEIPLVQVPSQSIRDYVVDSAFPFTPPASFDGEFILLPGQNYYIGLEIAILGSALAPDTPQSPRSGFTFEFFGEGQGIYGYWDFEALPTPGTVAPLALAGLALARRRRREN